MTKCLYCNKSLRLIGRTRKNGKEIANHNGCDWKDRKYHKKCFKELKDIQDTFIMGLKWAEQNGGDEETMKKKIKEFTELWGLEKLL